MHSHVGVRHPLRSDTSQVLLAYSVKSVAAKAVWWGFDNIHVLPCGSGRTSSNQRLLCARNV